MLSGCNMLAGAEFYVAIDNKGLWPNLTLLPDGEIAAAVYNHPSHGMGCGDIELWVSGDEGRSWKYRSTVSDHAGEPDKIRMNHAVGMNGQGQLVVLVSGWSAGQRRPILPLQVCISGDSGQTWRRHILDTRRVPYGDISLLSDGALVCAMYEYQYPGKVSDSSLFKSSDGGRSWQPIATIAASSETYLLCSDDKPWLAACRTKPVEAYDPPYAHGTGVVLYRSADKGNIWSNGKLVSPPGQDNAHLLRLADGRLLLSLTSRIPGLFGVTMRLSNDNGDTWSYPFVLVSIPAIDWHATDCGYPSSIQVKDGTIVTAFYFGPKKPELAACSTPWHQRYHMGVARWHMPASIG